MTIGRQRKNYSLSFPHPSPEVIQDASREGRPLLPLEQPTATATKTSHPIRLLTFSTLYPHRGRPSHGIFVENRLRQLVASGEAVSRVVAPVPWFPSRAKRFGDWSLHAQADRQETRHGLMLYHPRFPLIPRFGMSVAPASLAAAGALQIKRILAGGYEFDVIDAHYVYPDGVAAVALGRLFRKPVVLTARGSDITQYPDYPLPRRMLGWAMQNAAALISVSSGLKNAMVELGAPPLKITVLRNGVDLDLFKPTDPAQARALIPAGGPVLLSVGHLIERKGHHLAIRTLLDLPEWRLAIVGEGQERTSLRRLADELGLGQRVIFCGPQPHDALPAFYSAADVLILASSREGWANVLLEAMACGTPVVASNIPGNPEVVRERAAGHVVAENTAECFATAIRDLHTKGPTRFQTRAYAERFGWEPTTQGQLALFRRVMAQSCSYRSPNPARVDNS